MSPSRLEGPAKEVTFKEVNVLRRANRTNGAEPSSTWLAPKWPIGHCPFGALKSVERGEDFLGRVRRFTSPPSESSWTTVEARSRVIRGPSSIRASTQVAGAGFGDSLSTPSVGLAGAARASSGCGTPAHHLVNLDIKWLITHHCEYENHSTDR